MRRLGTAATLVLLLASPRAASAQADAAPDPPALRATVVCEMPAAPGRLRCDVEARGRGTLLWADAEIVQAPAFIAPLRGRVGPREATTREPDLWRFGLALASKDRGEGDVTVRVRAVVCAGAVCAPEEVVATGHVKVGS